MRIQFRHCRQHHLRVVAVGVRRLEDFQAMRPDEDLVVVMVVHHTYVDVVVTIVPSVCLIRGKIAGTRQSQISPQERQDPGIVLATLLPCSNALPLTV